MNTVEYIDKYKNQFSNSYEAVNHISHEARKILKDTDYTVSVSSALSCVLSGKQPCCKHNYHPSIFKEHEDEFSVLDNISDMYVIESVKYTVQKYLENDSLVYYYHQKLASYNKSRVRVLSNIIVSEIDENYYQNS